MTTSVFGSRVKARRLQLGMTQQELAEKIGYEHKSSVNKIENGQTKATAKLIEDLAKALGTSRSYLAGWADDPDEEVREINFPNGEFVRSFSPDEVKGKHQNGQLHPPAGYYLDPETAEIAQEIYEDKELRALFDAARDISPEDMKTLYSVALAMKRKERGE